ncbi:peptidoglycan editing factor PgeF [Paenibacillus sanguinis]|uniref:peptidoglycan editing factor PgeF n=1 Tax=Paenibacillus sanguinis TaxID=225906 RepID=UPI000377C823
MEPFISNPNQKQPERFELRSWSLLMPELSVGFTGKSGGVGEVPYNQLNLAYHVGDNPVHVLENRRLLAEALGFAPEAWTCGEQVHGTNIAVVRSGDAGRGYLSRQDAFQQTDGLLTDVPGVLLTSFYADCVPLYFADPVQRVVGLAHAGWKGTVAGMASAMVSRMEQEFGSRPADIRVALGPSIGECCYEVDEKVMAQARLALPPEEDGITESEWCSPSVHEGKTMLNLKEMNRIIMIKAGILPTHIECTTWCTSCHPEIFFSYRKQNGVTGRMASWIGMKER